MRRRSRYAASSFLWLLPEALKQPDTVLLAAQANPHNYDAWFDYLRLVENDADPDTVRDVYERAIANIPPIQEKRHWRRYIYLWINYALYEELEVKVTSPPEQTAFDFSLSVSLPSFCTARMHQII